VGQSPGPGKNASDGVGGGGLALLMHSIMAGDGTVGGFGLNSVSIRG
jgi:hypothetical protein